MQVQGLEVAAACGHFDDLEGVDSSYAMLDYQKAQVAWQRIVGQRVSHPHMDHVADFIVMSQELPFGGNYPVYTRETGKIWRRTCSTFAFGQTFSTLGFHPPTTRSLKDSFVEVTLVFRNGHLQLSLLLP